jgi:hypothetical protein
MLSRPYGVREPFHHYGGRSTHSHGLPPLPKDHLCEACLRTPFGTGTTSECEKSSSPDTTRLSLVYPKESRELRTSAEEGCRWCSVIADAILHSVKLDRDFEIMNPATGSTPNSEIDDGYNEDEGDDESAQELADTDRDCTVQSASECPSPSDSKDGNDEAQCYLRQRQHCLADDDDTEGGYNKLDDFTMCNIRLSYISRTSEPVPGYNILEIVVDVHSDRASSPFNKLQGDGAVNVTCDLFTDVGLFISFDGNTDA